MTYLSFRDILLEISLHGAMRLTVDGHNFIVGLVEVDEIEVKEVRCC